MEIWVFTGWKRLKRGLWGMFHRLSSTFRETDKRERLKLALYGVRRIFPKVMGLYR